jgi:RNA polymerase primary sigma factor
VRTFLDMSGLPSTRDSLKAYLKEVGRAPVLSAEQEADLARLIRVSKVAQAVRQAVEIAGGANAVEVEWAHRLRLVEEVGQLAKRKLIEANLRLVVSIAKRYIGQGVPVLDLIQEGNLGLIQAVDKFNHSEGYEFSTYAAWRVREAITRAIADQAKLVRMREPDSATATRPAAPPVGAEGQPTDKSSTLSLAPTSRRTSRLEPIEDQMREAVRRPPGRLPARDEELRRLLSERGNQLLQLLTTRERAVIQLRLGLLDGRVRTLEEVGREFGVTRERIRQILSEALAKLRDYLE